MLRRDWLQNAKYLGQEPCPGSKDFKEVMCNKWDKAGLQSNFYWSEVGTDIPRRIQQVPNDDQLFLSETYSDDKPFSLGLFELPDYCFSSSGKVPIKCPKLSICGAIGV